MAIPDSAKLARYDDLASLVEELHDENIQLKQRIDASKASEEACRAEVVKVSAALEKAQIALRIIHILAIFPIALDSKNVKELTTEALGI